MHETEQNLATTRWVILGCGYTGAHLARRLARGNADVVITRRSEAAANQELGALQAAVPGARAEALRVDVDDDSTLVELPCAGAVVVVSAPPRNDTVGEQRIVEHAAAQGAARIVYVSSTGVYPHGDGAWVDESVEPAPSSAHGKARLAAESALLARARGLGIDAVSLRAAGIYGPGRGVAARLRAGTYRVIGDGSTYVSRIHVRDLCAAIIAAGTVTPLPGTVFNVADEEPLSSRACADRIAEGLGLPAAPSVDPQQVSAMARALLGANRRIDARRLREQLGVVLAYPSVQDALAAGDL